MASPHIEVLLPELLEAIFSFIPIRNRLRIVSVVCKRWRTITLRTVKKLPLKRSAGSLEHFPFTALTKLDLRRFCDKQGDLRCPANVRHLRSFSRSRQADCVLEHLHDIPRLTSIIIYTSSDAYDCHRIPVLLRESQATLQRIAVFGWQQANPAIALLGSHHFPALEELAASAAFPDLCVRHASQLTRLSLSADNRTEWGFLRGVSFSRLAHMELPAQPLVDNTLLLTQCPALCSISLLRATAADLHVLSAHIARLNVGATVIGHLNTTDCATLVADLALLTHLTGLSLHTADGSKVIAALQPAHASLASLSLPQAQVRLSELAPCTRLTRLDVMDIAHYDAVLPSVSRLSISNPLPRLHQLSDCFPRLSKAFVTVEYPHGPGSRRALKSALRALEQRGVRRIVLKLVLYAMSYKRKGLPQRLRAACQTAEVKVSIDDRTSETEESSREASSDSE